MVFCQGCQRSPTVVEQRDETAPDQRLEVRHTIQEPSEQVQAADTRGASGTSNFVEVRLGGGVSFEVPKNWVVLSGNQRVTLDSSVESFLDLSGASNPASELPFAANLLSDGNATIAMLNVRFYPRMNMSQTDVDTLTPDDISQLDQLGKEETRKSLQMQKLEMQSWGGTNLQVVGGQKAFVVEYQRKAQTANDNFVVRLVRFFRGERSFTVTVSYRASLAKLLRPITDRIIKSIKCM
jgi:hypothetical protein